MTASPQEIFSRIISELEKNHDKYFNKYESVKYLSININNNIYSSTAKAIFLVDNSAKGFYIKISSSFAKSKLSK